MSDIYHTFTCTLGVKAKRNRDDTITGASLAGSWVTKPAWVDRDVRLLRIELEIPESFFSFDAVAKGKLTSRLQEEFELFIAEFDDTKEEKNAD